MATGLFASLPKPKYTGEHEDVPVHAQPKGPRIVGPGVIDESQIVLKVSGSLSDGAPLLMFMQLSAPALLSMDSAQDGDLDPQKISATVAPFQRFQLHNTR